jgi:phospholipid/cholesterol/gamma-HCH transport system permease protein
MHEDLALRGVRYVRRRVFDWVAGVGRVTMLLGDAFRFLLPGLSSFGLVVRQMSAIGVGSLWLVVVVSVFTGAVAAVQAAYQFSTVVPLKYIGSVILRSVIIELGPVLTALIVGGRVGSSIAAELGTMKVTEQIDAIRAMAANPVRKLVVPKVLAILIMLPILTVFADFVGIIGGLTMATTTLNQPGAFYMQHVVQALSVQDVLSGVGKSMFFALFISLIACHSGLSAEGGADGVGRATTQTVVAASLSVLVSDFFLTKFFLAL